MSDTLTVQDRLEGYDGPGPSDAGEIPAMLERIGRRVYEARKAKRLSRRQLSEMSGVSQRYLAQLETGQGNISIALLMKIAAALDLDVQSLLAADAAGSAQLAAINRLLPLASDDRRQAILEVLDPGGANAARARRIALIGLRGAGKSTLGRLSAERLSMPFQELNAIIEDASGMAIDEFMALYGQEGYRHLERQSLERVVQSHDTLILAVAGGIVSQPDTFDYLLEHFHTIWLKAEPEEHMARVRAQGDERPMAGNPHAMQELRKILTDRASQYARAAVHVDTSHTPVEDSLSCVMAEIRQRGVGV
jgi:XRE family aerobic/anaerobic benzoate catabolism transcriptional regulator